MKISIIHSQHSMPFLSNKSYAPSPGRNLTIRFGFWIIQFRIQEMARKVKKGKQLKFAPQLHKFAECGNYSQY